MIHPDMVPFRETPRPTGVLPAPDRRTPFGPAPLASPGAPGHTHVAAARGYFGIRTVSMMYTLALAVFTLPHTTPAVPLTL